MLSCALQLAGVQSIGHRPACDTLEQLSVPEAQNEIYVQLFQTPDEAEEVRRLLSTSSLLSCLEALSQQWGVCLAILRIREPRAPRPVRPGG